MTWNCRGIGRDGAYSVERDGRDGRMVKWRHGAAVPSTPRRHCRTQFGPVASDGHCVLPTAGRSDTTGRPFAFCYNIANLIRLYCCYVERKMTATKNSKRRCQPSTDMRPSAYTYTLSYSRSGGAPRVTAPIRSRKSQRRRESALNFSPGQTFL